MANPYKQGKNDPKGLEDALLGKSAYSYYDKIMTPAGLHMSSKGTIDALTNDVAGVAAYIELLAFGKSEASSTGGPLGNKYFMQTSAQCVPQDTSSNNPVPRYIYINNIPDGKFPILGSDSGMNLNMSKFEGLIPGVMEDILRMNPMSLFQAFVTGSNPPCREVHLPVGPAGVAGVLPPNCDPDIGACEAHHLLDVDIKTMNPAWFSSQFPKPSIPDQEGFTSQQPSPVPSDMPDDPIIKLYYGALGLLGLYILMKLFMK